MSHHVIYFDFDRTLLDTDSLKREQAKRVAQITGLSIIDVETGMQKYISEINHLDFTPEGYAFFLEKLYGINPSDVLKIYITDSNYIAGYLFPEVLSVLKQLRENGNSLGIYSGAIPGHQRLKIERTGVLEYIDGKTIVSPRKLELEVLAKLPDGVIVVDDDREVIEALSKHFPRIKPVWLNRNTTENLVKVPTINNLRELEPRLLKSLV